jgi:hypothetical protein
LLLLRAPWRFILRADAPSLLPPTRNLLPPTFARRAKDMIAYGPEPVRGIRRRTPSEDSSLVAIDPSGTDLK